MKALIGILVALGLALTPASAASLLPPGKQQFFAANGAPLAAGLVYFYVPGTTTPKTTYKDAGATISNTNPVQLDSGGFAIIYGSGSYRMVVKDSSGNTIYDEVTADTSSTFNSWAGTSSGSANAITLVTSAFTAGNGQTVTWRNQFTNTGATTITIGSSVYSLVKDTLSGAEPLTGGELTVGNISGATYDSITGTLHLMSHPSVSPFVSVASAATVDVGGQNSSNVNITGTAAITSLGSSASLNAPIYTLSFASTATLVHNATSLICPNGVNLVMKAGANATVAYLGSGNWRVIDYSIPNNWPTYATFIGGSGTYSTPAGAIKLRVRMVGGGGGGGGANDAGAGAGGSGGNTSFGTFTALGGDGGGAGGTDLSTDGGFGGTGGAGSAIMRIAGAAGGSGGSNYATDPANIAGAGGASIFGGAGAPSVTNSTRRNARANSGSGGAGATSSTVSLGSGAGGGAGEYVEFQILQPAATYSYVVGAAGTAGASGGGGTAGGTGASGLIQVEAFFK